MWRDVRDTSDQFDLRQKSIYAWLINQPNRTSDAHEALAAYLTARNLSAEMLEDYFRPRLKSFFPEPYLFADMEKAVCALIEAVKIKAKIMVFADYDVDGATSGALLVRWFQAIGHAIDIYVPDRLNEGYGPSVEAMTRIKSLGCDLLITVDCGASAHKALSHAAEIGLKVVVIDHHLMSSSPPEALAVVNPNRLDCASGQGHLAAAGVVYVLLAALNRAGAEAGLFSNESKPDILQWLDLAALGAVCDVTKLIGFNRALVVQGLKLMANQQNIGIKALLDVSAINQKKPEQLTTYHCGFIIGPRINAGGRVGRSDLGLRLLSTSSIIEAEQISRELDELNLKRRDVESGVLEEAKALIEQNTEKWSKKTCLVIGGHDWHPGVIGIVAGRLKELYHKPVFIIGIDPISHIGKGSGRSVEGINLGAMVQKAFEDGILLSGGGHAMAAGLTIQEEHIEALQDYLHQECQKAYDEGLRPQIIYDSIISLKALTRNFWQRLEELAPFGPGNPEPIWMIKNVRFGYSQIFKGGHISTEVIDETGTKLKAMAWRAEGTSFDTAIKHPQGLYHLLVRLKADDYGNRRAVMLEIDDMMLAS